jgi:hypothetical protein
LVSEQGDFFGLDIYSGLIRRGDGTWGVYVRFTFPGRDDVEPEQKVLTDESGAPVRFATEREARIAAFDWFADIRRDTVRNPPPGLIWTSEGKIEPGS